MLETTDITSEDADGALGRVLRRGLALIWTYIRLHPAPFAVAVTCASVYAAMTVTSSIVLGRVTDRLITPALTDREPLSGRTVLGGMAMIVGVAVVRALGIVGRRFFAGMGTGRTQATLRNRVVETYQRLPLAYHRTQPTGELLAHAEADVAAATDLLHPLPYSVAVVVIIVVSIVALVLTDPVLAIVGLALIPILGVFNIVFTRRLEPLARRAQDQVGEVSNVAHESFDGALMVKTLGLESAEVERFRAESTKLREQRIAMGRVRASFAPGVDAVPGLATVALLALGAWRLSTGAVTTGQIVQFAALFSLLTAPLRVISYLLYDFPTSLVGYSRVKQVLDEPITDLERCGTSRLPAGPLSVGFDDVSFRYLDAPVLDGVDIDVPAGSTVALVGSTGAGKSTLVQLIGRLADPAAGTVTIGGIDVRSLAPGELQRSVAIVFQESYLFAASVRENVAFDGEFTDDEVWAALRLAQAERFVHRLSHGIDTVMGERGVTLSGGQRQRIALARALVRRPRLLVLDDATSALDPIVEARILDALRAERETTLVIVAHRVSTIALADRVVMIDGGRVLAAGTHAELLATSPAYESLVRAYELETDS